MIGVILLMGLVTKNAILLVDGALQHIREGRPGGRGGCSRPDPRRLRPILMTSFAMAIGMVPTAISTGTGSEFRSPMAIAVIGGSSPRRRSPCWWCPSSSPASSGCASAGCSPGCAAAQKRRPFPPCRRRRGDPGEGGQRVTT